MAVDTQTKRRSALGMVIMALAVAPVPDGTVAAVDREHIIGIYAGISPATPGVATTAIHIFSTSPITSNFASDSGDNVLVNDTLEVQQDLYVGGATNYVKTIDGDTVFVGAAGLSFGSCYGNHIGWAQASAIQNTWYNISDASMVDGNLHNVAHDGSGKLTVTNAGMYLVTWSCCFEDDAANDHIEIGIEISGSGSANGAGQVHLENKFANEEEHSDSSCILDLAANATLEVAIRTTDAGTPTISVQAVNISALQVGGT